MCFAWTSVQTAIISICSINLSVFITEAESVYCAVRTGSSNPPDEVPFLKGFTCFPLLYVSINVDDFVFSEGEGRV
jgi:hypothetical protein